MPSTSSTHPHSIECHAAEQANKHTPDYFRNEALKKIEELRVPRHTIAELQSSLELIMKKYESDRSYIDRMAEWFKKESWTFEASSFVLLSMGAVALTYIPTVLIIASVIATISVGLYYLAKFFLVNHYNQTSEREQQIKDHIINMEANVLESVKLLNDAENQINRMLISLCEINAHSAEKLQTFDEQILVLNTQMTAFLETIGQLETLKDSLVHDNEIITSQLQHAVNKIEESKAEIEQGALRFQSVTNDLEETNKKLSTVEKALTKRNEEYQAHLTSLAELELEIDEQILNAQHFMTNNDEIKDTRYAPVDATLDNQSNVNTLIQNSNAALLNAALALKAFDEDMENDPDQIELSSPRSSVRFFIDAPPTDTRKTTSLTPPRQ